MFFSLFCFIVKPNNKTYLNEMEAIFTLHVHVINVYELILIFKPAQANNLLVVAWVIPSTISQGMIGTIVAEVPLIFEHYQLLQCHNCRL